MSERRYKIANRYEFKLVISAGIIGSPNLESFQTVNASRTGIAIKAIDKPIPFREGTLVDIEVPLGPNSPDSNNVIRFLGKVVRIDNNGPNKSIAKTTAAIKLIEMSEQDGRKWETLFGVLETQDPSLDFQEEEKKIA